MEFTLLFKILKNINLSTVISKSNKTLMTFDKEQDQCNYDPETLLDTGQCYVLKKFSETPYCLDFLKRSFSTASYEQWDKKKLDIEYILNTDGEDFFFRKYSKTQLLKNNWFALSEEPSLKNEKIITIKPYASAYYSKIEDTLYFYALTQLKGIFPNIENLYKEATRTEVNNFLNSDFFNIEEYDNERIGMANRKRIALFQENFDSINDKDAFFKILSDFCPNVTVENGKATIETEDHLKQVLFAVGERYYETPISHEKRLANSIIKINNDK